MGVGTIIELLLLTSVFAVMLYMEDNRVPEYSPPNSSSRITLLSQMFYYRKVGRYIAQFEDWTINIKVVNLKLLRRASSLSQKRFIRHICFKGFEATGYAPPSPGTR